ncbi:MAG: GNAT family N-acetyltransferase, partial [Alphaproteobacteria bacterium]
MGERAPVTLPARVIEGIDGVDAQAWDACAGDDNPFVSHAFLEALEHSGSVAPATGWAPRHLVLEDEAGGVVGAVPMYLKAHSYGEYVFDHAWADAFERAGGRYYPKLQVAVPFTPVTGPRLLVRPDVDGIEVERRLLAASLETARNEGVSSLHITFPTEKEWRRLGEAGLLLRTGLQFNWENRGYGSFDDFLADLASRKRKVIRRERHEAVSAGVRLETLTGDALRPEHWDAFYRFYMETGERKWGYPYLTRDFFDRIARTMRERIALMMASRDGRYVAGALNFIGTDTLYGRYWGCIEDHRFLHFEACYYQAIEFAIARGLKRVEAGAQGPHKLQRGYLPRPTYSAHWIRHPGLGQAVAEFLRRERAEVDVEIAALSAHGPFRRHAPPSPAGEV